MPRAIENYAVIGNGATPALDTEFETDDGIVRVVDFMTRRDGHGAGRALRLLEPA
jgi:hypothetical protein